MTFHAGPPALVALDGFIPVQLKRRGVALRMVLEGDTTRSPINLPLLKAVARARRWSEELISGRVQSALFGLNRRVDLPLLWARREQAIGVR